jgi:hypothetical protein
MKLRSLLAVRVPLEIKLKTSSIFQRRFSAVYWMLACLSYADAGCATWAERVTCIMPLLLVQPGNDMYDSPPILGHSFMKVTFSAIFGVLQRNDNSKWRTSHGLVHVNSIYFPAVIYIYIYILLLLLLLFNFIYLFLLLRCDRTRIMASSFLRFLDYTTTHHSR